MIWLIGSVTVTILVIAVVYLLLCGATDPEEER